MTCHRIDPHFDAWQLAKLAMKFNKRIDLFVIEIAQEGYDGVIASEEKVAKQFQL